MLLYTAGILTEISFDRNNFQKSKKMYKTTTLPNPPSLLTFPIIATKSLPLDTSHQSLPGSQFFFEDQFGQRMEVEVVDDAPTAGFSGEGTAVVPSKKMKKGGQIKKKGRQIKIKGETKAKKKASSDAIELTEEEERGICCNLVENGLVFNQTLVQY